MTPIELQKALKDRVFDVLYGMKLSSQEGKSKEIQIFEQHLPRKVKSTTRNPEETHYPCVIIYLDEGENEQIKVLFIIATHDASDDNQGYRDALSIVEKIKQDLHRNPVINNRFEMTESLKWFYNDQDNHPYYFAWIETNWEIPRSLREDVEAMI